MANQILTRQRFSSPIPARFQAWLTDGVCLRNEGEFVVVPEEQARAKMLQLAQSGYYDLVTEIADQLRKRPTLESKGVVSRSFRMSFPSFAKLAYPALKKNSSASWLLRDALVHRSENFVSTLNPPKNKLAAIRSALDSTSSLQKADPSAYSRDEYRITPDFFMGPEGWHNVAQITWDQLASHISPHLSTVAPDQLQAWGAILVSNWTDFFITDGTPLEFRIRKEQESVKLEFGIFYLNCFLEPEQKEELGLDQSQVEELSVKLGKFNGEGNDIEDEDFAIELPLWQWNVSLKGKNVVLDSTFLTKEQIEKKCERLITLELLKIEEFGKGLGKAINEDDLENVSKISGELAALKRGMEWIKIAYDALLRVCEDKPAIVSFTADDLIFQIMVHMGLSIEDLVDDIQVGSPKP